MEIVKMELNDKGNVSVQLLPVLPYQGMALVACDFVRHIAKAYEVPEEKVWEIFDKERENPTAPVMGMRINPN